MLTLQVAQRGTLRHLSVNAVHSVGPLTMRALALCCKESLETLDISFCRKITDDALGVVADKCHRLRSVTLFGCSQITQRFVHGHSNQALMHVEGLGTMAAA